MTNAYEQELPPDIWILIGTNGVPSEKQADAIRELLLKRYREVFPLLESRPLTSTRTSKLRTHIGDLEALISPARKLIPELVSTIFELCVSTQGRLPSPHPHEAPLVLGQICASWRHIALSTPKLWRSVLLRLDFDPVPRALWFKVMEKRAMTLESWLARAGSVPIFCHIKSTGIGRWSNISELSENADAVRHLVSKLVPYVSQWQNIHLHLPFFCLTPVFDIHQADAPLLRSLAVTNVYNVLDVLWLNDITTPPITWSKFPGGARLRQIQIDIPRSFLPNLRLPWTQVEELTMMQSAVTRDNSRSPNANLTLQDALDVLRRLPNLRRCALGLDRQFVVAVPTNGPVVIPKLQKLSIYAEPNEFGLFLQAVILPKLERLTIHKHWSHPELQSFLVRCNHPLKELDFIRIRDMSDDNLFDCLQLVPSLRHLQTTSPVGALVLRALTPSTLSDNTLSCLCPQLDFVELNCWRPFDALVEMIEGRCQRSTSVGGVSQLKRARLHLRCKPDDSEGVAENEERLMRRLRKCADAGLDITWSKQSASLINIMYPP